ncbi:Uncharacterized protein Adt_11338 [Abeliophyllum distichum]|uniref:DUF4283 domain-containing protein n=1 Tax=Abeliophyllum distichum TaxID=126358 RepID=A0ABD1UMJ4_9LAMI
MAEEGIYPPMCRKSYAEVVGRKAAIPSREKSFEGIVTGMKSDNVDVREASVYKNEPYIPVSKEEMQKLAQWFKYGLVGKFSHVKPPFVKVQQALNTFELSGDVSVGNLDGKHILLNFDQEEDYCRIFAKPVWSKLKF